MSKSNINHFREIIIIMVTCAISATLGFVLRANKVAVANVSSARLLQQSDEKTIERTQFPNEPFEFSNLSIQNTKISPRQKISVHSLIEKSGGNIDSWMENLKFTLKNITDKRITYIAIELDFPETKVNGPMMVYNQLGIGIPPYATEDLRNHATPLILEPSDTIRFTLSAKDLQVIKQFLSVRNFQLANINNIVIRVDHLIFDDGMKWQIGRFYKPNPNKPSGYELISPNIQ
jgi:hypothetical protein